ncbi:MAG TPA: hypothetical protein VM431_12235 [Phycisphaerae bacterium]|nr:hypothetical protein [Phycisphaerae bacterium]
MNRIRWMVLVCMILAAPAAAPAEQPAAAPPADAMVAVAKVVVGTVETRPAADQPWVAVTQGMKLAEGADLRTGFRARCILDTTDSLVQVDPLTVLRIGELRKDGEKVRTRLFMKHGNTQAVIEKRPVASDFAIVTPSATLSVRGTSIKAGFFPVLGGTYGTAQGLMAVRDAMLGRETTVAKGETTDNNATPPIQLLAELYLPVILDSGGYDKTEKVAAGRWHASTPIPVGLQGNNPGSQPGGQEIDPGDTSQPGDDLHGGRPYRGDDTIPPPPGG